MAEQQLRARQMVLQQQAASAVAAASKTQREVCGSTAGHVPFGRGQVGVLIVDTNAGPVPFATSCQAPLMACAATYTGTPALTSRVDKPVAWS